MAVVSPPRAARPSLHLVASSNVKPLPPEWQPIVVRLGLSQRQVRDLLRLAALNGTTFQIELFASTLCSEANICREIARELGLSMTAVIDRHRLIMSADQRRTALSTHRGAPLALLRQADGHLALLLSPSRIELSELRRVVLERPALIGRLRIVVPSVLRRALIEEERERMVAVARDRLHLEQPQHSARVVLNGWQGAVLGAGLVAIPVAFFLAWQATWLVVHAAFSLFFLACVALRVAAALSTRPMRQTRLGEYEPSRLPVYTVLVALHREARIIPQLLAALSRIKWPRSKLEIKLVCEADDHETLAALKTFRLHPCVEVVEVPPGEPRTKPKALAYALPMSSGEFVTLYDAEDQPHPEQLVEAWQRFHHEKDELACLQAPLVITNGNRGLLPTLFAFEYAALFRGLLPWLARQRLILPLGGTSNHFRRRALEQVGGGWDPYNVTEDADLGIRLARFGYRSATITRPTLEDAPETVPNWGRQRTRWFKGWMQTWLVHLRRPAYLIREIGSRAFVATQALLIGMIVSALANIVFAATLIWIGMLYAAGAAFATYHIVLLVIDLTNITLGYLAFFVLGWRSLYPGERKSFWKIVPLTPFYWLAMSFAAWRAVWQLYRRPHHWEKTDHPPRRRRMPLTRSPVATAR